MPCNLECAIQRIPLEVINLGGAVLVLVFCVLAALAVAEMLTR